jgi:hypothetical protein
VFVIALLVLVVSLLLTLWLYGLIGPSPTGDLLEWLTE